MKHIKPFFETILEYKKLYDELSSISYILEDEGYEISIIPWVSNRVLIMVDFFSAEDGAETEIFRFERMAMLQNEEFYKEYMDRINAICGQHDISHRQYMNFAKEFSQRLKADTLIIQLICPFLTI